MENFIEYKEFDESCLEDGWYSCVYSWDSYEGSFEEILYFKNGFERDLPIYIIAGPFDTKKEAENWNGRKESWF